MQPTWLIEANVAGLPSEALQAVILGQGMSVRVVKPFLHAEFPGDILGAETVPLDFCVVFCGTLTLMSYIQRRRRWAPGGWCNFDNLKCSTYYAHFGPFLLNRNYSMMPAIEAIRQRDRLYSSLGRDDLIFVRPDSVDKSFAGKLVDVDSFKSSLSSKAFDQTTMVLVAEPREIACEWRLFIAHSKIVNGSQYRRDGRTDVAPGIPQQVAEFASKALAEIAWRPDPLFVMDVCESNDGFRIVELNSFSCSGHCECDLDAYVSAASRFAALQW